MSTHSPGRIPQAPLPATPASRRIIPREQPTPLGGPTPPRPGQRAIPVRLEFLFVHDLTDTGDVRETSERS